MNYQEDQLHLSQVVHAFQFYESDMFSEISRRVENILQYPFMMKVYPGGLPAIKEYSLNLRYCVHMNQQVFDEMLCSNKFTLQNNIEIENSNDEIDARNLSKVRSTLHQCVREWSIEGKNEREKCYEPLLDYLCKYVPLKNESTNQRIHRKVLVPGSGLGRLPVEIVGLGYSAQGNEFSYQMLLMSEYLFNKLTSSQPKDQREIFPWIHDPSNHKSMHDMLRGINIPDKSASEIIGNEMFAELSMYAGEFISIYNTQIEEWDSCGNLFLYRYCP